MIARAKEINDELGTTMHFVANTEPHLQIFPNDSFDFVYSRLVLQHLPRRSLISRFIGEFVRTLRPGGLIVFQLPSGIPLRQRVQTHRRVYPFLRAIGLSSSYLLRNLRLTPMPLMALDERKVRETIERAGGRVLRVDPDDSAGPSIASRFYFATKTTATTA
jgi:SAM-dependent methyltransferase